MSEVPPHGRLAIGELARRTAVVAAVISAFAIGFMALWLAADGLIAVAVGVLLATLFDAGTRGLGRILPWGRRVRLVIVFALAAVLVAGALWWGGSVLAQQAQHFFAAMKDLLRQGNRLLQSGSLGPFLKGYNLSNLLPSGSTLYGGATTIASTTFRGASIAAAMLFLGAFFAWDPPIYKAIVLSLLPKEKRRRVSEVLDRSGEAMREWLIGQGISMAAIFLFSLSALILVGMPYPVLLAVQAGLLTFIPTLGPFIAGVVIILAGLSQSFTMALYGLVTYLMVQFIETHLVTPVVQEQTLRFPPASTLALQVIAGFVFGLLGIAFVVPIAAAGRVFIEELYVNDQLGGPWEPPRRSKSWFLRAWSHLTGLRKKRSAQKKGANAGGRGVRSVGRRRNAPPP